MSDNNEDGCMECPRCNSTNVEVNGLRNEMAECHECGLRLPGVLWLSLSEREKGSDETEDGDVFSTYYLRASDHIWVHVAGKSYHLFSDDMQAMITAAFQLLEEYGVLRGDDDDDPHDHLSGEVKDPHHWTPEDGQWVLVWKYKDSTPDLCIFFEGCGEAEDFVRNLHSGKERPWNINFAARHIRAEREEGCCGEFELMGGR